jgi:NADPH:quinone reductase-like Zn-dependent oxidoreductase
VDLFTAGPLDSGWAVTVLSALLTSAAEGSLRPYVAGRYPLTEAAAALRDFEVGGMVGRVVLVTEFDRDSSAAV